MSSILLDAEHAKIDPRKLRDYALSQSHPSGRFKAAFFAQMGYSASKWQLLESDIRTQHLSQPATPGNPSPYGVKYTITAPLRGPFGILRWVTTVWIVRSGDTWPELITIEPASRRKE